MLEKKYRTPVQKFPRKAKTAYTGGFFVIKNSQNTLSYSRVGAIVSKDVARKATRRNKIKRIVMSAFRDNIKILSVPGVDHLVIMNSSDKLDDGDYKDLERELGAALAKLQK